MIIFTGPFQMNIQNKKKDGKGTQEIAKFLRFQEIRLNEVQPFKCRKKNYTLYNHCTVDALA